MRRLKLWACLTAGTAIYRFVWPRQGEFWEFFTAAYWIGFALIADALAERMTGTTTPIDREGLTNPVRKSSEPEASHD